MDMAFAGTFRHAAKSYIQFWDRGYVSGYFCCRTVQKAEGGCRVETDRIECGSRSAFELQLSLRCAAVCADRRICDKSCFRCADSG